ncbi:hypothetical protein H2201_007079 [Coniosporium apollinis]|uniref:TMEM205-like domain-containing protein n=1 Tax=Coniosporium apollinis TaxID=61459 RepID=A0ABQ9NP84_9PEZI|nr:hypothetical protein H2201_007079 [Coniosporium apollinis]
MASLLDALRSLLPYHLLAYGTLLGTQLYQSFINTGICYRALPLPQFTTLQKRIFPAYFRASVALVILTAATHPPKSVASLVRHVSDVVPLAIALAMNVLNWLVFGPKTTQAMIERIHQETRDGRSYRDVEGMSEEMRLANRKFSRNHAMCIHLNAIAMVATVWYGFSLGSRITVSA